jgi:hypothetical protein
MTSSAIGDNVKCLTKECIYSNKCLRKQGIDYDDPEQSYLDMSGYCNQNTYFQDFMSTM